VIQVAKSVNHPENILAKFGYILDIKVQNNRILLNFWLPTGTYHKILVANLGHFFHEKAFV
jgi:hypothetical protein